MEKIKKIPEIGDPLISKIAKNLEGGARESFSNGEGSYIGVETLKVFEHFGLKEVEFLNLPDKIKEEIIKATKGSVTTYGVPLRNVLEGEGAWPENFKVVANKDFSTVYFFTENPDKKPYGNIACTRFRNWGGGYKAEIMNHDLITLELVSQLCSHEAQVQVFSEQKGSGAGTDFKIA